MRFDIPDPSDFPSFYYPELNEFSPKLLDKEDEDLWEVFYNDSQKMKKELMK